MGDETKGGNQGTPQGQSSDANRGSTSFTEADVKKAVSDALADQGRKHKAAIEELTKRLDEQEDSKVKDKPEELDIIQRRRKLRDEEARIREEKEAVEREKAEHAERLKAADAAEWDGKISAAAKTVNGDPAKLKEKAALYGITDAAKLEGLASDLWPQREQHFDSGESRGSPGKLTPDSVGKMDTDTLANHPEMKELFNRR